MLYRSVNSLPFAISVIGLRGWSVLPAGRASAPPDSNERISAVQTALDLGVTYVEVPVSRDGDPAVALLSKALQGRRDRVVLAGVCGAEGGAGVEGRVIRRDQIVAACEAGLRAMRTDRYELLFCRWPDASAPLDEVREAFSRLLSRGEAVGVGVSHYGYESINAVRRTGPLHAIRSPINLLEPDDGNDVIPFCQEHGIAVIAADPFCHGLLETGSMVPASKTPVSSTKLMPGRRLEANRRAAEQLRTLATEANRSLAQIALTWALAQPGVTTAVTPAERPSEVRDQVGALGWMIPEAMAVRIDDTLSERDRQLDR
jgi:aryl-alcohol dehydrogenase-like predicted oxidoreductase